MKPHELDVISLVSGLAFLVLGIAHLVGVDITDLPASGLWPLLLILGGGILLVQVRRRARDE